MEDFTYTIKRNYVCACAWRVSGLLTTSTERLKMKVGTTNYHPGVSITRGLSKYDDVTIKDKFFKTGIFRRRKELFCLNKSQHQTYQLHEILLFL